MRLELTEIQHFLWRRRLAGAALIARFRRLIRLHAFVPDRRVLLGQASGRHNGISLFEEESTEQGIEFGQPIDRRRQGRQRAWRMLSMLRGPSKRTAPRNITTCSCDKEKSSGAALA